MTHQTREPLVKRLPHDPKAHVITNPAIYRWQQRRAA